MTPCRRISGLIGLMLLLSLAGASWPAAAMGQSVPGPKPHRNAEAPPLTPERKAAALAFAAEHVPELVELLDQLREHRPAEYKTALRELSRTQATIADFAQRSPETADFQLRRWKLESRIQLTAARHRMRPGETTRQELRELLTTREELRYEQLELEKQRLQARLERVEHLLATQREESANRVDRQLRNLIREADGQ